MIFILSTMTNSVAYQAYFDKPADLSPKAQYVPRVKARVLIHGGANLPSHRSGFGDQSQDADGRPIWSAAGIITPITEEKFEAIKDTYVFKKHLEAGWLKILSKDIRQNYSEVKKHVATMAQRDSHAQLSPSTLKQKVKVRLGAVEKEEDFRI